MSRVAEQFQPVDQRSLTYRYALGHTVPMTVGTLLFVALQRSQAALFMAALTIAYLPVYLLLRQGRGRRAALLFLTLAVGTTMAFELYMGPQAHARIILCGQIVAPFCILDRSERRLQAAFAGFAALAFVVLDGISKHSPLYSPALDATAAYWFSFIPPLVAVQDIFSQLRFLEARHLASLTVAKTAQRKAEVAAASKGEFLANMSHELRTPLNGVLGAADLLMTSGRLTEEQEGLLHTIHTSGDNLLALINDILDLSKIEAGGMQLEQEPLEPADLLADVAELVSVSAAAKGVDVVVRIEGPVPHAILGDALRLRQVLLNLASNAVKFTPRGRVTLCVEAENVTQKQATLCWRVEDTGIGIAPDVCERLFDAFVQADSSTTRRFGGTGLGLSISQRLSRLMGAQLTVESTQGVGSTFRFRHDAAVPVSASDALSHSQPSPFDRVELYADDEAVREGIALCLLWIRGRPPELVARLAGWRAECSTERCLRLVVLGPRERGVEPPFDLKALGPQDAVLCRPSDVDTYRLQLDETARAILPLPARPNRLRQLLTAAHEARRPLQAGHSDYHGPALHILVVDDNRINRTVASKMLEKLGHSVTAVASGRAAVAACRERPFDLVFMDCQMPGMDGYEATVQIKALPTNHASPAVVALTANVMPEDRARCEQAGMCGYLSKPLTLEALVEALRRYAPTPATQVETATPVTDSGPR